MLYNITGIDWSKSNKDVYQIMSKEIKQMETYIEKALKNTIIIHNSIFNKNSSSISPVAFYSMCETICKLPYDYDDTLAYSINNLFVGFSSFNGLSSDARKVLFMIKMSIDLRGWIINLMHHFKHFTNATLRQRLREKLIYVRDYYIGDDYISYL